MLNIFNEKTSEKPLCRMKIDTVVFIEAVTKLWNILINKSPSKDKSLNDPSRKEFETPDDQRLKNIQKMANSFKKIDTSNIA